MSSADSRTSTTSSSRLTQFGFRRNFDERTEEFLRLSRRRQLRQGCACAAVSTAITVTIVVTILLLYEYNKGTYSRENHKNCKHNQHILNNTTKTTDNTNYKEKINAVPTRLITTTYFNLIPKFLQSTSKTKNTENVLIESTTSRYETTTDATEVPFLNVFTQNIFRNGKMSFSNLRTRQMGYNKPFNNLEYFKKIRQMKEGQQALNYFKKMIDSNLRLRQILYMDKTPKTNVEVTTRNNITPSTTTRLTTSTKPITGWSVNYENHSRHSNRQIQQIIQNTTETAKVTRHTHNCSCSMKLIELLNNVTNDIETLIPESVLNDLSCTHNYKKSISDGVLPLINHEFTNKLKNSTINYLSKFYSNFNVSKCPKTNLSQSTTEATTEATTESNGERITTEMFTSTNWVTTTSEISTTTDWETNVTQPSTIKSQNKEDYEDLFHKSYFPSEDESYKETNNEHGPTNESNQISIRYKWINKTETALSLTPRTMQKYDFRKWYIQPNYSPPTSLRSNEKNEVRDLTGFNKLSLSPEFDMTEDPTFPSFKENKQGSKKKNLFWPNWQTMNNVHLLKLKEKTKRNKNNVNIIGTGYLNNYPERYQTMIIGITTTENPKVKEYDSQTHMSSKDYHNRITTIIRNSTSLLSNRKGKILNLDVDPQPQKIKYIPPALTREKVNDVNYFDEFRFLSDDMQESMQYTEAPSYKGEKYETQIKETSVDTNFIRSGLTISRPFYMDIYSNDWNIDNDDYEYSDSSSDM